ncbi:MAG: hypothetical protein ACXVYY_19825 [Oryzihumus sp.]
MRKTLLAGVLLACAAMVVVLVSAAFGLDLESVALLGAALGAVVALVPDRTPAVRLGGFAAGFVVAWLGYLLRAGMLPDTAGGRAVAVGLVVLLCVAVVAVSRGRIPLWSTLLGTAALSGAYEFTFAAAPPEVVSTSMSTATTLLFNVAVGFLAAALIAPADATGGDVPATREPRGEAPAPVEQTSRLDDFMMEETK